MRPGVIICVLFHCMAESPLSANTPIDRDQPPGTGTPSESMPTFTKPPPRSCADSSSAAYSALYDETYDHSFVPMATISLSTMPDGLTSCTATG